MDIALVGGYGNGGSSLSEIEVINISDEGVVSTANWQLPELQVDVAQESNDLICGGTISSRATNKCKWLNPESFEWEERCPMLKKRYYHAMSTASNRTRYVCGGLDESATKLKSCEKLNENWSFIKELPIPLESSCMIGTDDFLYLMGGLYPTYKGIYPEYASEVSE